MCTTKIVRNVQVRADVTLEEDVNRNWGEITSKVSIVFYINTNSVAEPELHLVTA
jgi:hypothetical protein